MGLRVIIFQFAFWLSVFRSYTRQFWVFAPPGYWTCPFACVRTGFELPCFRSSMYLHVAFVGFEGFDRFTQPLQLFDLPDLNSIDLQLTTLFSWSFSWDLRVVTREARAPHYAQTYALTNLGALVIRLEGRGILSANSSRYIEGTIMYYSKQWPLTCRYDRIS